MNNCYFVGKQALSDAILQRWYAQEREFDTPVTSLVDLVLRYLETGRTARELTRTFLRETLEQDPADVAHEPVNDELTGLRARQQAGGSAPTSTRPSCRPGRCAQFPGGRRQQP